jgi:glycosyltransferase involved in cell wall biosynthesis
MADNISIAMCTWNGALYLPDQLASIAAQTRPPAELVVCDDQSTDKTCEIISNFANSAPFPVYLHVNEQNLGSTKNFERAIGLCGGDIIALADQDDVWLPEKLRRIEDCFEQESETGLVFTDAEVVDEDLKPLGYRLWQSVGFGEAERRLIRNGRVLDVLLPGWTVTGATMAFRAGFRDLVLEIPTDLALIHDGWIALLIGSVANVSFIDEPLIKYRQHARQQIGAKERKDADRAAAGLDGARAALRRTNSYNQMIAIGTRAQQRLAEHRNVYKSDDALRKLEQHLKHLRARANLPSGKLSRARCVLRELLSGRYRLYSNGIYSAVKDLARYKVQSPKSKV